MPNDIDLSKVQWDETPQIDESKVQWDETPAVETKEPQSWGDWLAQQGAATARGMRESLPLAKDISAASRAYLGNPLTGAAPTGDFTKEKEAVEEQQRQSAKEAPIATAAGEIGGYFLPLGAPAKVLSAGRLAAGPSLASGAAKVEQALASKAEPYLGKVGSEMAAGAATGAGLGAVQGLGTGTDLKDRLESAGEIGGISAIGGAAFPAIGAGIKAGAGKLLNVGTGLTAAEKAAIRQGAPLPRFLGAEGEVLPKLAEHVGALPVVGAPIRKAAAKALEQTGEAFENIPGIKAGIKSEEAGETASSALQNWVRNRSAKTAEKAYDAIENHVRPDIKTELTNTRATVQNLMDKLKEADLPEESEAVKMVLNAATNPQGLNFSGIKTLRTKIREKIDQGLLPGNLSQGELKQIKTALDADLRAAAQNAGGARGLAAFERANTLYQNISKKREQLAKIVGAKGDAPPTTVYSRLTRMAMEKTGNPERLMLARKSMSPEEWGDVTSGVVNNMGRDAEGNFSPLRFLTEYGRMSERGRDVMFGPVGNPVRDAIEDFGLISQQFKKSGKYKNWSNTANNIIGTAGLLETIHDPVTSITYGAPVFPLALLLASPKSARQFSNYLRNPNRQSYASLMKMAQDAGGVELRAHMSQNIPQAERMVAKDDEDRTERASGGKVGSRDYPAKRLTRIERALKRAQDALALETKAVMQHPDETVAQALRIAEKK